MEGHENEVELMDYLNVIWKRKWLIIVPTFILVVAVGIYSLFLPKVWEIDALIMPSKFLIQTGEGEFREIVFVDPGQIASQINHKAYNNIIAAQLNLDVGKITKIKAENLKGTKLVRVSIKEENIEKAKLILNLLFTHLKRELDTKSDIEMKGIESQIKSKELEKLRIEEEIKTLKNKLKIVGQGKKDIEKEMRDIKGRIKMLEEEQGSHLKKKNRSESESLAMLLYSNEIQQSLQYYNTLNESLGIKRIEEEDINLQIENKAEQIKQTENEIDNLNEKKGRIDHAQLIKEPTASLNPVSPKLGLNLLICGILGLMIFVILSFFLEYIEKQKAKG